MENKATATAVAADEVVIVTKMSVKGIGCKPAGDKTPKRLCRIYGRADGIKAGESKDGRVWSALTGSFEALNFEDGKTYRSGKLFLPGGIHETIENAVKQIPADADGITVRFALELRSVEANNPIGYSYQAVNILPASQTDELDEIRRAISDAAGVAKQLAAPPAAETKSEKPAEKPAPKKGK